nr:phage/plasmid primase, P4 family [uncultured Albidiferax sp.]
MTHVLSPALQHLASLDQFVVCKFTPSARRPGKTEKIPVDPQTGNAIDPHTPANWLTAAAASTAAQRLGADYGIGFVLTQDAGLFVIDIDGAAQLDGTWNAAALALCQRFPGAAIEVSQSGTGLHIFGRYAGTTPAHKCKNMALHWELYTEGRFIALGGDSAGDASTFHTETMHAVIAEYFPPAPAAASTIAATGAPVADDDALLALALRSASPLASFGGGKATFRNLWEADATALGRAYPDGGGRAYDASSADAAMAQHLAFWCGRDAAQMERLMRRCALVRDKWERTDYLPRTIAKAIGQQHDVYSPGIPATALAAEVVPAPGIALPGTEDALAELFVNVHAGKYLYVPALEFLVRDGPVFTRDNGLQRYSDIRPLAREEAKLGGPGAKGLAKAAGMHGALSMARSDPRIRARLEDFDADPYELNTPGGVVDLRTGAIRPQQAADRFMQVTHAASATKPSMGLLRFLEAIFPDAEVLEFMQRSAGYWLTGTRTAQALWFLCGPGGNGKSTLLDALHHAMGAYATKMPAAALMVRKGERHPTELAMLRGKRLAVSNELPAGEYLNEALIKELTGDDTVAARLMRQDYFEFTMSQKHVLAGNHRPKLHGGDGGMSRRLLLVDMPARFTGEARNENLLAELKADAGGMLSWAIEGAAKWHAEGGGLRGLRVPASVVANTADYMHEHDDVGLWLDERCDRDAMVSTKAMAAYTDFRNWKVARGEVPPSTVRFSEQLQTVPGIHRVKTNAGALYQGFSLRVGVFS